MQAVSDAWTHYVDSRNLLTELRGLTREYPFSVELVDEGRRCAEESGRMSVSWCLAWVVLLELKDA